MESSGMADAAVIASAMLSAVAITGIHAHDSAPAGGGSESARCSVTRASDNWW
ncbi:hypothetical protein GP2_051_00250 [Gordonia paraffinivorans NBRC 108238]|uniref:Uncharacterized protein n=1 Tax=Gordonia paraffinivorans NBRC 108238 TaxID=1223543 RepID=A0ABQ0IRF3_9ACTN|nr:hypothetical protein GP2_051_00250 [Gordonia paraffinivorans NBRC 108238]